jgi:hypothetical protein
MMIENLCISSAPGTQEKSTKAQWKAPMVISIQGALVEAADQREGEDKEVEERRELILAPE